jgi:hypothetical protein
MVWKGRILQRRAPNPKGGFRPKDVSIVFVYIQGDTDTIPAAPL